MTAAATTASAALGAADSPRFTIDRPNQLVWRGDAPVKVPPKVFQLLLYLRDKPGRILEFEELLDAVWPREFVQPEILKTYIRSIRKLLDDDPQSPRFIETRPRVGYRFIGQLPDRSDIAGVAPGGLVGREGALATLQAARSAAANGQRRVVFLVGEAGCGKTRVIDEFLARVRDDISLVLRLDCAPGHHGAVFSPGEELAALVAQQPEATGDSLPAQMEAIAAARPVLVVIDGLQGADEGLLKTLAHLATRRGPLNLMVVASYRASTVTGAACAARTLILDLVVHSCAQEVGLHPLDSTEVRQLVLAASTVDLPRGALDAIARQAGGNPFVVTALVECIAAQVQQTESSQLVEMLASQDRHGEFVARAVPLEIRHSLELQLRELGAQARRILECGSSSGLLFSAWCVSKVLGIAQVEVEELCSAMSASEQLLRESSPYVFPDGSVTAVYAFRVPLHARLLLAAQTPARRDMVQQRFIEAVEAFWGDRAPTVAAQMARRFEAVHDWPRAVHYSKLAVANAARNSSDEIVPLLQHGLRLADRLPPERRNVEKEFFLRQLSQG
ncbi:MAG: winged helix-turn-helix domain-containing protein [Pseudomonadota bacterium]